MTLRHAFTRLITTLWIDYDYARIQLPDKIRLYDELENDNTLLK
jgi:hypothetical protein